MIATPSNEPPPSNNVLATIVGVTVSRPACALLAAAVLLVAATAACRSQPRLETRELPSWGNTASTLLVDIPPGYSIRTRKGVDFDVHYIQAADEKEREDTGCGIYVGHQPSFAPPRDAKTRSGSIAGEKVTWYEWQDESAKRKILRGQTLVPALFRSAKDQAGGVAGLQVHIFIWASGEEHLRKLRSVAETLRVRP